MCPAHPHSKVHEAGGTIQDYCATFSVDRLATQVRSQGCAASFRRYQAIDPPPSKSFQEPLREAAGSAP